MNAPAPESPQAKVRYELVRPGSFDAARHYYPRTINAQIHSLVRYFLQLGNERVIERFCHLNPRVKAEDLREILEYQPRWFRWAGSDLFHATSTAGVRRMVVIETNSCPSGQKSMPLYEEHDEQGGYRELVRDTMLASLKGKRLPDGELAVIYDKNPMESSGYAAAMADLAMEPVHLVRCDDGDPEPSVRFDNGVLMIRDADDQWVPIRAAFRYVTQRPWNRIPLHTKTAIVNPVLACLAGGRNKMVAAKAYELYNADLEPMGLEIRTPKTIWDVALDEVPLWVRRMGGFAVVKVPYSNAGQGVFTITNDMELQRFMGLEHRYSRFIVQSLIGHHAWSSSHDGRRLYHVGTVPNKRMRSFVADLRVMVGATEAGFRPMAIYARRAREPLEAKITASTSWAVLGTNLSVKLQEGWDTDTDRLLLMDRRDFNTLGIGIDDLIEAYVQTVLSTIAIDRMAMALVSKKGTFRPKLFRSLNDDQALLDELRPM
jgi:hypothetical protein